VGEHLKREAELAADFKSKGLEIYAPDIAAFRANAQRSTSPRTRPKPGRRAILDRILAVK